MKKIYLAGPDVFRDNPNEHFIKMKELCQKYGFIGLSPIDNENDFDGEPLSKLHSIHIFHGNLNIIKNCDIIIANLIPFRGSCVDDGTAWEIGCGYSYGKLLYGYTPYYNKTLTETTHFTYNLNNQLEFTKIEKFDKNSVNLMLQESIELSGGKILETFEDCLIDIKKATLF
jgi:nucleoside 2-deoxyribosyltransferase